MQCVPENSSWGQRVPLDKFVGEAAPASPSSSVGEDDSEGSVEPEEGWDSGEQSKPVRRSSLHSQRLLLSQKARPRHRLSAPNIIFMPTTIE